MDRQQRLWMLVLVLGAAGLGAWRIAVASELQHRRQLWLAVPSSPWLEAARLQLAEAALLAGRTSPARRQALLTHAQDLRHLWEERTVALRSLGDSPGFDPLRDALFWVGQSAEISEDVLRLDPVTAGPMLDEARQGLVGQHRNLVKDIHNQVQWVLQTLPLAPAERAAALALGAAMGSQP